MPFPFEYRLDALGAAASNNKRWYFMKAKLNTLEIFNSLTCCKIFSAFHEGKTEK